MGTLDGKVAIVAGGGTGVGRAISRLFAREGARVAVFGRRPEPLREVAEAIAADGGMARSVAGDFSPYVASKGGLNALARAAAVELAQDEIRVNVVAPGTIDTPIGQGAPEFRRHLLKHRIPIGRAGHVDDIASARLYPAPDAARYVTGSILAVDGGWTAS
jgi:NAD(P)-dependent dehydrogenase (short-subunit alcohol dehydrogenase family)